MLLTSYVCLTSSFVLFYCFFRSYFLLRTSHFLLLTHCSVFLSSCFLLLTSSSFILTSCVSRSKFLCLTCYSLRRSSFLLTVDFLLLCSYSSLLTSPSCLLASYHLTCLCVVVLRITSHFSLLAPFSWVRTSSSFLLIIACYLLHVPVLVFTSDV